MINLFTNEQISQLQTEYGTFDRLNPDVLPGFRKIFAGCSHAALAQLAYSNIKFVSGLAKNELYRRTH